MFCKYGKRCRFCVMKRDIFRSKISLQVFFHCIWFLRVILHDILYTFFCFSWFLISHLSFMKYFSILNCFSCMEVLSLFVMEIYSYWDKYFNCCIFSYWFLRSNYETTEWSITLKKHIKIDEWKFICIFYVEVTILRIKNTATNVSEFSSQYFKLYIYSYLFLRVIFVIFVTFLKKTKSKITPIN